MVGLNQLYQRDSGEVYGRKASAVYFLRDCLRFGDLEDPTVLERV